MSETELQLALAKMIPEMILMASVRHTAYWKHGEIPMSNLEEVKDTEWLHVCWLVEKSFGMVLQEKYEHELSQVVPQNLNTGPEEEGGPDLMIHREWDVLHATWHQRAEALLRATGKWK